MTSLPDQVTSDRLRLVLITPADVEAFHAGRRHPAWHPDYPRRDDLDAASLVRAGETWGPRHVVRAFDGLVVGSIGFFGAPTPADDGTPETAVGFGLVEEAHGHGAATEALQALLRHTDRAGVRIRASVHPADRASLRVLAKCQFTQVRGGDEDGNLVLARPVREPA